MTNPMIRVRFAPSPTGSLHLGGARTALYNYLFAKKHQGQFIVRVEDTDLERSSLEAMQTQLDDLHWLGLRWDEGIEATTLTSHGPYGPYRQSERSHIYLDHAKQLLDAGKAYYCFLTDEAISEQREQAKREKRPYQVRSPYRDLPLKDAQDRIEKGELATIRFKTPDETQHYAFQDLVRGEVRFPSHMVADFVLLRANGMPVYNFCCAIDDALMKISHVFRAEEHLPNTLRQLMLYQAFGYEPPQFGHLSIILGEDKKKLSKRQGAVSCAEFREQGFLPEALLNYIALLGWSDESGDEILSLDQLSQRFSTTRLNPASAIFDKQKLHWVNAQHLRQLDKSTLWQAIQPFLDKANITPPDDPAWQEKSLALFTPNMETLADAPSCYQPLLSDKMTLDDEAKEVLTWDTTQQVVRAWLTALNHYPGHQLNDQAFADISNAIKDQLGVKGKQLFMPLRIAMIGKAHGAELKSLVELLTRQQLIDRASSILLI